MKEEQINEHLTYLEAVKEALIPNYKSDWIIDNESDESSD